MNRLEPHTQRLHRRRALAAVVVLLLASFVSQSCKRVPPRPPGSQGAAVLGWVIMAGEGSNPDQEFVCQSQPRTPCEIRASRPNSPVFADVHFYFHPVATETRYAGSVDIGFFSQSYRVQPNITVEARGSVANQSVVGQVTTMSGAHAMTIAVVASSSTGANQPIDEQIAISVK